MRLLLANIMHEELAAKVTLAGTCEGALRLAGENVYDLILLDLLMPGIGGFEVLSRIRANSVNRTTPVIVVSVLTSSMFGAKPVTALAAMRLGANAVVRKPLDRNALVTAVKEQLHARV